MGYEKRAAVALVAAILGGLAPGSLAAESHHRPRPTAAAPRSPLSLAHAPASLRAAVRRTLGAPTGPATNAIQQAELTGSDGAAGDDFGFSVAISGSTAVVGAPSHDSNTGAAYVFVRVGSTWTQQAELIASDGAAGNGFGDAVAISGSTVIIGSTGNDSGAGAAYVFARSGTVWTQQAELTASDGAEGDYFGASVGISGSTAVVGEPSQSAGTGAAYVFSRSGTVWSLQAELNTSYAGAGFGSSVAISGSTAVVGAAYEDSSTGAAYVFTRSGTAWAQRAELTVVDAASGLFGSAVAISGSTAVVGAPFQDSEDGAAYVFGSV